MTLSPPAPLSDADKLAALKQLDQFREWRSLDEKRYCLVCNKIITGREIQVVGGTRANRALRVSCPTERCNSIPMDWVLPTDEILALVKAAKFEERIIAAPRAADSGIEHGLTSRLRRLALHFMGASSA